MGRAIKVEAFTHFPGLDAIEKTAKKRAITQKAVKAGAKLVQQGAKSRAPKRSGALKTSIGIKAGKGTKGKTIAFAVIGARAKVERTYKGRIAKPSKYAHLVEKGTKAHFVRKRRHPGAKAKPFLAPALEGQRAAVGRAILDALAAEIQKVLAKQAQAAFKKFKR